MPVAHLAARAAPDGVGDILHRGRRGNLMAHGGNALRGLGHSHLCSHGFFQGADVGLHGAMPCPQLINQPLQTVSHIVICCSADATVPVLMFLRTTDFALTTAAEHKSALGQQETSREACWVGLVQELLRLSCIALQPSRGA